MRFAGYVAAAFSITGAVLSGYWLRLVQRTRRAERNLVEPQDRQ